MSKFLNVKIIYEQNLFKPRLRNVDHFVGMEVVGNVITRSSGLWAIVDAGRMLYVAIISRTALTKTCKTQIIMDAFLSISDIPISQHPCPDSKYHI